MDKPTDYPDWATEESIDPETGQANRVEPPDGRKSSGWLLREVPPRQWLNWTLWKISQWIRYQDYRSNRLEPSSVAMLPSAVSNRGKMFLAIDESTGEIPVYSDGETWRRFSDNEEATL